MAGTNLRSRDGLPFNFVDGLKGNDRKMHGLKYQFAGNGSNLIFTLPVTPSDKDSIDIFVKQLYIHSTDYSLVNNVVTFLTDPPAALDIGETYNIEIKVSFIA